MKKKRSSPIRQITLEESARANPALEERRTRIPLSGNAKLLIRLAVLLLLLMLGAILLRYDFLHKPISAARYFSMVASRCSDLWRLITGGGNANAVLYSVNTILIVALVGGCLACCGCVYQGIFHTPMASPSMLGIQSGGMLAAVAYLFFCCDSAPVMEYYTYEEYNTYLDSLSFYELYARQIWMLAGCFLGALLVIWISSRAGRGKVSSVVLILSGSLFGAFANAAVSLGQYYFTYVDPTTDRTYALMSISMGTFANTYSTAHLLMLAVPILLCMTAVFLLAPGLNALMFGDEEAKALGIHVNRFRTLLFILCIIPCAVILSFCGQIGFVGLIVPHFARQMAGSDYRRLLPASALTGAIVMVLVYAAALCTGYTTSINLITSVVGGAVFLFYILRYRRCRNADWA